MMEYGDARLPERFWDKVEVNEGGCWLWTGALSSGGYGWYFVDTAPTTAHRVVSRALAGDIPPGMEVDHKCRVRRCVNPDHLHLVTHKQNLENHDGPRSDNRSSGVRGVTWNRWSGRWLVQVRHNGKTYGHRHHDLIEAEREAVSLRNRLHSNNLNERTKETTITKE